MTNYNNTIENIQENKTKRKEKVYLWEAFKIFTKGFLLNECLFPIIKKYILNSTTYKIALGGQDSYKVVSLYATYSLSKTYVFIRKV